MKITFSLKYAEAPPIKYFFFKFNAIIEFLVKVILYHLIKTLNVGKLVDIHFVTIVIIAHFSQVFIFSFLFDEY